MKNRAYCNDITSKSPSSFSFSLALFPQPQPRSCLLEMPRRITQCSEIIMTHDLSFLWNNLLVTVAEALSLEKK